MSFLNIKDKCFVIAGVANKKSVASHVAVELYKHGAKLIFSVEKEEQIKQVKKIFGEDAVCFKCDVQCEDDLISLQKSIAGMGVRLDGILHSMAFANFSEGPKPFHEVLKKDFMQACDISCFSLMSLSNGLKELMNDDASVVTISISTTKETTYGYLGPIKAALDSSVSYLAKSFSEFSNIRFNAVCAGPLKTSASAGIPNYINSYLFAEKLTLRKKALQTKEVANAAVFLLSPASSGINASNMVIDAGMSCNHFDEEVVKLV